MLTIRPLPQEPAFQCVIIKHNYFIHRVAKSSDVFLKMRLFVWPQLTVIGDKSVHVSWQS